MVPPPPRSILFPYTTLFRSEHGLRAPGDLWRQPALGHAPQDYFVLQAVQLQAWMKLGQEVEDFFIQERITVFHGRSEEHTSELQSRFDLVCRLLLEKKKNKV